jgi:multidrug efflux pump subunit AcrA (membrane-fusion protein)
VEQPGRVEALAQTPVHAKVSGFVSAWHKDIGDAVEAGTPLAEIAVPELDQEFEQKQAALAQAKAEVNQAKMLFEAASANTRSAGAAVAEAEAGRLRAKANYDRWQSEAKRFRELAEQQVIDKQNRDETLHQFRAAEAALAEVEARIKSAEALRVESTARRHKAAADVTVAEAKEKVAAADMERTRAFVGYTHVVAPFKGVVTARHVDVGYFLQPTQPGEPLFVVTQADPVRIFVDVPEADAAWVKDGAKADVRVQAVRGRVFPGKVTRTAWALDARSRTLRTAIDLPNPNGDLRPGMYAYAAVTVKLPEAWSLPTVAVVRQGDSTSAFLVRDGKAVRVGLEVGHTDAGRIEVFRVETPPGSGKWADVTGREKFVLSAAGVTDGQALGATGG